MTHKDHFGREIKVGDRVAYTQAGYRALATGTVDKINAKTVRVVVNPNAQYLDWSHCHPQDVVIAPEFEQNRLPEDAPPPGAGARLT